ncbi:MAG: gfo/Idh/MocA family oxidoreductase [Planctomycetota bacterium]|nr:MAG: gfo/Idh/MocA family oxidoreductase [Planctomycetota bacterium]
MPPISRRSLLKHATLTGMTLPLFSLARLGRAAASDKLRLAGIGVGGMGGADLASLSSHPGVEVVALVDVDAGNLAAAGELHKGARRFTDFRTLFDQFGGSFDAVHVSTPDHTHAPAAMTALNHGKHVYCQKPLTHDVHEARQLRAVAAASPTLVTQMGTQIHSNTQYRTAVKLVQSGIIGKVREAHSWSSKTWGYDGPQPESGPVPTTLDWNLWLGTAAERPFCPGQYHPGNWRRWYDFGGGTMGDMAIHILDPVFSALALGPARSLISKSSAPPADSFGMQNQTRFTFPAGKYTTDGFVLTWYDGGKMPDTSAWPLDGADGKRMGLPDQGSIFLGEKGAILLPHVAMPTLLPLKDFAETKIEAAPDGNHYHLFVDACLGGAPTTCGFNYAGPLTETVLLGTLANRFPGDELRWQPAAMTIPNHDKANALLRARYRKGFEVDNLS